MTNSDFPMFDAALPLDLNVLLAMFATFRSLYAQVIFFFNFYLQYLLEALKQSQNPWRCKFFRMDNTCEHSHGNWHGELPVVHRWPYDYTKPGKENDFVPQNVPLDADEEEH